MADRRDTASGGGWSPRRLIILGIGAFVATLAGSVFLWNDQRDQQFEKILVKNAAVAKAVRHDIWRGMEDRVAALERMADRWVMQGPTAKEHWVADVKNLQRDQPGYQAIEWVDPSNIVTWIVPMKGNEAADGLDLGAEETRRISLEKSRNLRMSIISETVELVQGERGFLAYAPIFIDDVFHGFILGVFRVEDTFNQILRDHTETEHFITIIDEEHDLEVYSRPATGRSTDDEGLDEQVVTYGDMAWRVKVWPGPDLEAEHLSSEPDVILGLGVITAMLLLLSTRLAYTAAKRNEALARSEASIRAMFDSAADGIITINEQGMILSFNAAASRIFGHEIDDVVGRDVTLIMPERLRSMHLAGIARYLQTGESRIIGGDIEVSGLHKSGHEIPLHLSVSEVRVGAHRTFTGIVRDFTELKRARDELEQSEMQMRTVMETAADGMITIESGGSVVSFNPAATRIFGYSAEEMIGTSITRLLPEQDRAGHLQWLDELLGEGESRRIGKSAEFEACRKDGTVIIVNLSLSEMLIGGEPHYTGIVRDITELQRVQHELADAKERFELAVRGTDSGLWDWNVLTGESYYSPRFKSLLGYEEHELENERYAWDARLHPDDRERVWQEVRDHLEKRVPYATEHRVRTKAGTYRWFLDRGQAIWNAKGQAVRMVGGLSDITDRKVAELELAQARDAALEANRMKTEFLANVSHELRTPLNGIIGHAEMLLEDLTDPEMVDDVRRILTAGRHLLDLVNDLLNLERIEAGKAMLHVESFDARTVVEDVAATVQPLIEANGNHLDWSVDASLGLLESDPVKMRQILFNLLSNSAKFTKDGRITLDVLPEAHDKEPWILLRVKDEGIGIPADRLPYVFDAFTQADATISTKYGGTGLGLTLTQRLSRLLGGDIEVASEEGRGSTFEVRIPQRIQQQDEEDVVVEVAGGEAFLGVQGSGARLLVVDDHEDNRNVLSRRLRRAGYSVSVARSGEEALERIDAQVPDLVMLDIMMPGISGIEVLQTLRKTISRTELPVIMATAMGQSSDIVKAFAAGANDYVTKPLDFPVVLARVATQIELLRLRQQREQLMALKDEFLAIASHDLRNPLARVLGYTSLVAAQAQPGKVMTEQAHAMLGKVERAASVMQSIIEDFLELAAVEGGRMQLDLSSLDVNKLCRDMISEMSAAASEHGITLELKLDGRSRPVMADERRIRQVMQNLLDNAIKYCRSGDRVTVRTTDEEEGARIEVSDTGPGLSSDDMRSVFTRFAKLSARPRKGERSSRMGLSIVRQIVMLHGGDVGVRNNEDGGATFWVILRRRAKTT